MQLLCSVAFSVGAAGFLLLLSPSLVSGHVSSGSSTSSLAPSPDPSLVLVNKCCEKFEIHVDNECQQVNETGESNRWKT